MKKILCGLCFLLLFIDAYTQAPNSWKQMNSSDVSSKEDRSEIIFSIGNNGYMLTTRYGSNEYQNDFWQYDPVTDTWTQKANFTGEGRVNPAGFSIGSKGYIGTGYGSIDPYFKNDFWEYDTTTNAWTQKADFGGTARFNATGFSIGNKGYIGTGFIGGTIRYTNDFWEYDPATDTWTKKADFPGAGRYGASSFSIGNKGYIGTGYDETFFYKDFWEYDPVTDSWAQKADFGGTARLWAVGFSIDGKGYIGTGIDKGDYDNDFWEYDPVMNKWIRKADFGGTVRFEAVGCSIGSYGYLGFGGTFEDQEKNDWWQYTPGETLPLKLISFTGEHNGKSNVLHWSTSAEVNSSHFDIERSNDGSVFTKIGTVIATGGNLQNNYSYTDMNLIKPFNYYRLKITDKDATYVYSKIIRLSTNSGFDVSATPNPATGFINLRIYTVNTKPVIVTITNPDGKIVYNQQFSGASGSFTKTINVIAFARGIYLLKVFNADESRVIKFIKE